MIQVYIQDRTTFSYIVSKWVSQLFNDFLWPDIYGFNIQCLHKPVTYFIEASNIFGSNQPLLLLSLPLAWDMSKGNLPSANLGTPPPPPPPCWVTPSPPLQYIITSLFDLSDYLCLEFSCLRIPPCFFVIIFTNQHLRQRSLGFK